MTPYQLLGRYPDPTRPLITHYDGSQNRVELSVATTRNAVAKASSMLRDGLGLAPGSVVSLDLPRHWQLPVWVLAALSAGARVGRDLVEHVEVRLLGPSGLPGGAGGPGTGADDTLVSSCDSFGMPVPGGVPSGVIDIAVEVRGYPDTFTPEPAAAEAAALLIGQAWRPYRQLTARPTMAPGARLWIDSATDEADLLALFVEPLFGQGSIVIGLNLDEHQAATIRAVESAVVLT